MTKQKAQRRRSQRPLGTSVWLRPARPGEGRQVASLLVNDPSTAATLKASVDADRADGQDGSHCLVLVAADRHHDRIVGMASASVPTAMIGRLGLPTQATRVLVRSLVAVSGLAVVQETVPTGLVGRLMGGLSTHFRATGHEWIFGHVSTGNAGWLSHIAALGFGVGAAGVDLRLNSALWPHNCTLSTGGNLHAFYQALQPAPAVELALMPVPAQLAAVGS